MGNQDQGGCFIVLGILMLVAGFLWWWPLFIMGAIFLFCGICSSSKAKQNIYQQAAPTSTQQSTSQQAVPQQSATPVTPQPVATPVPEKPPAVTRFCPDCGSPVKGEKFCSSCGKEID